MHVEYVCRSHALGIQTLTISILLEHHGWGCGFEASTAASENYKTAWHGWPGLWAAYLSKKSKAVFMSASWCKLNSSAGHKLESRESHVTFRTHTLHAAHALAHSLLLSIMYS